MYRIFFYFEILTVSFRFTGCSYDSPHDGVSRNEHLLDRQEAQSAFQYSNRVRNNHSFIESGYALTDNFLKEKTANNFESIAAGYNAGINMIKRLTLDERSSEEEKSHRVHLLGIDPFWADCYDIRIGFARNSNSNYKTYYCVLIAKHKL
jgi:hypothetical protein